MRNEEIDYLDGEFTITESEPSTIDELKSLIGEEAIVENVVANLRYRNKYPRVYRAVSVALTALGFARPVKETKVMKDKTVKNVLVSEMDHIRAARTATHPDTTDEATGEVTKGLPVIANADTVIAELFSTHGTAEPLYVKGERSGGGGKISAAALDTANSFFAAGDEVVESKVEIIEAEVPGYKVGRDGDGNATPESVARGIQALNKHLAKKAQAAALNVLA